MADGLLNKASIILTPTGYKAGTLYNVAPVVEPYEDFDFARASVASRVNSSGLVEMVGRTLGSELVQNGDFSELGSELVTNGDFATDSDWIKAPSGVTIIGGSANFNSASDTYVYQDILTATKTYKIIFSGTINSGSFYIGENGVATNIYTSGTYTNEVAYFTVSSSARFIIRKTGVGTLNASIDNVSVQQVDPNDYWNLGTGWSISDGKAISVGGADFASLNQEIGATSGNTYKVIFTITEYTSGQLFLNIQGSSITYTSTGTYTAYVVSGGSKVYFVSGSGSNQFVGSIDNVSVKEIIDTNNIPRISYDSNGDNGHILLEPTTTNLYLNTDTLSTQNVSTSASDYSVSFYGTGTITFSGSYSGSLVGTGVNDRVSLTFTATSGTLTSTVSGSVTNAQIENLGYSTSYMPSLSTQGVRATETATGAGSAELINSTEGVLYAEIAALADDGTNRCIALSDGSVDDRISLIFSAASDIIRVLIKSDGSTSFDEEYEVTSTLDYHKVAIKYKANDFALWIDGVERFTDTSGSAPIGLNQLTFDVGNGILPFYGKCKALAVFNEALSDDELNNLTG